MMGWCIWNPLSVMKLTHPYFPRKINFCQGCYFFYVFAHIETYWCQFSINIAKNNGWIFWAGVDHGQQVHDQQHLGEKMQIENCQNSSFFPLIKRGMVNLLLIFSWGLLKIFCCWDIAQHLRGYTLRIATRYILNTQLTFWRKLLYKTIKNIKEMLTNFSRREGVVLFQKGQEWKPNAVGKILKKGLNLKLLNFYRRDRLPPLLRQEVQLQGAHHERGGHAQAARHLHHQGAGRGR